MSFPGRSFWGNEVGALIPSLLYHDVCEDSSVGGSPWTLTPAVFKAQLRTIRESGRTPMSVSGLAAALTGAEPLPNRPVVISFDDGYSSWLRVADELADAGLPAATMYITTGFLNTPGFLSSAAVSALPDWVDVGAHSVTHRRLDELSSTEISTEIDDSLAIVQDLSSRPCTSFAYPHGNYDPRTRQRLISAGFTSAAAVRNAFSHPGDDVLAMSRLTITSATSADQLRAYLDERGAPVGWTGERLQTRLYRYARRAARSLGRGR
jgi:peptidoglycan/xylan/chitin deacetylase (PgdA/CDA1 family)